MGAVRTYGGLGRKRLSCLLHRLGQRPSPHPRNINSSYWIKKSNF